MELINKIIENTKFKYILFLSILTFLSLLIVYYADSLHLGHDYYYHYRRFDALMNGMLSGNFPCYIDYESIEGFGYLSNVFYPDLILIPFVPIAYFISIPVAFKLMLFVMSMLCGIFTYKTVRVIFKSRFAACISAIVYTFSAYRLLDIYIRGAFAEVIAFTFIPIIILGLYYILKGDYAKKWYVLAIGFIILTFTHLLSSIMMLFVVLLFLVIYNKTLRREPKRLLYLAIAGFVSALGTTFVSIPLLEQISDITFRFQEYTLAFPQSSTVSIPTTFWNLTTGLTLPTTNFNPRIGVLPFILICVRLLIRKRTDLVKLADTFAIIGLLLLLPTLSFFPWNHFPFRLLNIIQYPWRFMEFITLFFCNGRRILYIMHITIIQEKGSIFRNNGFFHLLCH